MQCRSRTNGNNGEEGLKYQIGFNYVIASYRLSQAIRSRNVEVERERERKGGEGEGGRGRDNKKWRQ